jgi:hypothetical protein
VENPSWASSWHFAERSRLSSEVWLLYVECAMRLIEKESPRGASWQESRGYGNVCVASLIDARETFSEYLTVDSSLACVSRRVKIDLEMRDWHAKHAKMER